MNHAVSRFSLLISTVLVFFSPASFSDLAVNSNLSINQHINGLMDIAMDGKNSSFVDYVKENELVGKPDKDGHTPMFAAMFGSPGLINDVIELGESIETRDNLGYTPLISAALLGYPQAVDTLLKKGAKINARNDDGQTAILVSVLGKTTNHVDVNATADNQWHNRWGKVVEILLNNGADINAVDHRGVSPLFMAIFSQDYALCRQLIKAGANVNHKLPSGVSMLQFAKVSSSRAVIDLLITNGAEL